MQTHELKHEPRHEPPYELKHEPNRSAARLAPEYDLDAAYSAYASSPAAYPWKRWLLLAVLLALANIWLWFNYTESGRSVGLSAEQAPQSTVEGKKIMPMPSGIAANNSPNNALDNAPPAAALTATAVNDTGQAAFTATNPSNTEKTAEKTAEKTVCIVWEFYSNGDVKKADNRLAEQAWSGYTAELADEPPTYMVFVGPFERRSEFDAKLKVIEKMKLKDYSALPSAIISLGVLSTQAAADALKASLSKRGLTGVQTSERTGSIQRTRYRFGALKPDSLKELTLLAASLGSIRACP